MTWPFAPLDIGAYSLIYADHPWRYRTNEAGGYGRAPERHYRTMTTAEICDWPVGALAAPDSVYVFWAIWPRLPDALQVMASHGFRYCTGFPWVKLDAQGNPVHATGYRVWGYTEFVLIGTRGRPPADRIAHGLIMAQRGAHSAKPDQIYDRLDELAPPGRRVELCARRERDGYDAWGDGVTWPNLCRERRSPMVTS